MKVLVVTHFFASHGGGIEIAADRLNHALRQRDIEVQWAASDVTDGPAEAPGFRTLPMSASNFAEHRLGFPYPLWSPASLRRLAVAVGDVDVVHLHDSLYFGNVCAFTFAKLKHKPVIITQHIGVVPYRSLILRSVLHVAYSTLGRTLLSGADQVVFIADQVRVFFEGRLRFRRPPLLVMNGVDTMSFVDVSGAEERAWVRDALGLSSGKPTFLFVGRFVEKKGLLLLRSLAEALPGVQWVFAGWGELDPGKWNLPHVRVFRRCSPDQLRKLYVAADLLVLPSVGEGFPLVVQESMACGTPVIVSNETAAACPAAGTLILHEDVEGPGARSRWTDRLGSLASAPAPLGDMRADVATFAREQWSWTRTASVYEQWYRRLVVTASRDHPSQPPQR